MWLNANCIVVERFIKTLKNKIDKHMTPVSKNVYMDKLNKIVDKYNNTYHRKIKIKTADINSVRILTILLSIMTKILEFKVGNHGRNTKIFLKKAPLQIGQKTFL